MKLRNGKEYYFSKPLFSVDIDFDHASKMWRLNKISIGEGSFKYKNNIYLLYNGRKKNQEKNYEKKDYEKKNYEKKNYEKKDYEKKQKNT